MKYSVINLEKHEDSRGKLIAFEKGVNCPFEVKRAFFMYDNDIPAIRGSHSNQKSQFLLIAVKGKCKIKVIDGQRSDSFILDSPEKALYLDKMIWKEISDFSKDAIILVLASEKYDADEYMVEITG
ncbi:MAG: FdtA/QdtA family cupin domain-containing protein [Holosporaceae bacterium]|jgi:dTDP-4-dehydrorhamnose 3,5-epimerase-like enzyme|nr:FdtA/QdtA family cupin domain-containing protein [Holosporaceae bacterium]